MSQANLDRARTFRSIRPISLDQSSAVFALFLRAIVSGPLALLTLISPTTEFPGVRLCCIFLLCYSRGHGCDILGNRTAGGFLGDRIGNPTDQNEPGFGTGAVPVVWLCTPSGSDLKFGQETAGPNKTGTCHGNGGTPESEPDVFSYNFWQLEQRRRRRLRRRRGGPIS